LKEHAMAIKSPPLAFERPATHRDESIARADRIRRLVIPARRYLMIDGTAIPGSGPFRDAFAALYPVAYTLHFALKRRGVDEPVGALEGLYWTNDEGPLPPEAFGTVAGHGASWHWRLLLAVPEVATDGEVRDAISDVRARKQPRLIDELRCETWAEGRVAQILHIGPYGEEKPTVERLHAAIREAGLRPRGCHHEIYISDPNRTDPARIKTVIRQPVEFAE
jgi:hypothetical protein